MGAVFWALYALGAIASLVCFILVVVAMFNHGQTGLGIACIVLIFCGIGGILTYIMGWVKSGEWQLKNVMLLWTVAIVLTIVGALGVGSSIQVPAMPAR